MSPKDQRRIDDFILFAIAAAKQAVDDSGWKPKDDEDHDRTGVLIGSGIGGLDAIDDNALILKERGPAPGQPVLHSVGADQSGLGPGLDRARLQGPEPFGRHRLRHRRACDRRCGAPDRSSTTPT